MMALRRLIPLTVFLLALAATRARAADEDEPHLKDRTVLGPGWFFCDHLEFSRDGRMLFTFGTGQRRVHIWDVAGEKQIASLWQDGNRLYAFATSPDGKLLATVRGRGEVWIWDARTFKKIRSLEGREATARLLFGPDSETLSAVAKGNLYVCRVNKDVGFRLEREINPNGADNGVRPVASSRPVRKTMLVCDNWLFDAVTGAVCYRLAASELRGGIAPHVAITSDEKKMAEGGPAFIAIWDLSAENEDPARRKRLVLEHPKVLVRCLTFSPNNQILAVGYDDSRSRGTRAGGILFFDAASGKLLDNQDARIDSVRSLAFSPDGRLLASGDDSGTVKLWDVPAAWRKKAK